MGRRLAAVLAADVVGYARLVRADEERTLASLKAILTDLIDPKITEHDGRVVKLMGDGMLAEFGSVVGAVQMAVEAQQAMTERNANLPEDQRIVFRVGINLGDVIVDGDEIHGDGVNLAARLEALAEPGGICISAAVYDQVRDRLQLPFRDMGEQKVKNLDRPVRVWQWVAEAARFPVAPADFPAHLGLPDKPSIAVLPFDNMSADPDQEFFADGLTEDIITSLSKISSLFVIARHSTFAYGNKAIDIRRMASELGVRYALEGSVRKGGSRIRVTAQLVDAADGSHVWAENYDRKIGDIFDIQDEITQEITTTLQVRLTEGEQVRLRRRETSNLAAWDLYVRARTRLLHFTFEENMLAREQVTRALQLDPKFATAWALLAWTYLAEARVGWGESNAISLERAADAAVKGLAVDEDEADAHAVVGATRLQQRRYDEAADAGRRAIALAPSAADHYMFYAQTLNFTGRPQEALALLQKAMRLSPFYPDLYLGIIALSYRLLGRYDEAIAADKKRLERNPENVFSDLRLAAVYVELGHDMEARFHVREALRKNPRYTLAQVRDTDPYEDEAEMAHYLDLLRKAGLPK